MPVRIDLPYNWTPRDYQMPVWTYFENGGLRAMCFWHRRAGKDLVAVNLIGTKAMERIGAYWHVFPTYRQGKKIAWEGKTKGGRPFIDHFPPEIIARRREQELVLDFVNGSSYHIVGADNPDSQVGTNPVGIVFSEYALLANDDIWKFLLPILMENGGWAIFITTPRGRNHAYRRLQAAQADPKWFWEILPYQKTGAVTKEQVDEAIRQGMSPDLAAQEFECSFDAALEHAYWGNEMKKAQQDGRIGVFPADPNLPVSTAWDLGMYDDTAIWWFQLSYGQRRMVAYRYAHGQSLSAYYHLLQEMADRNKWVYKEHFFPHDVKAKELGTGFSREKTLMDLGMRNIRVVAKHNLQDGIQAARSALANTWFNEPECGPGLEALRQYSRMPLEGQFDTEGNQMFGQEPKHDWTSHGADAFRIGVMTALIPKYPGTEGPKALAAPIAIC